METILQTSGLTRAYGETTVVSDLSLTVRRGEIYGFLGRNGAGKSTTIRMLLNLVRPDSGTVEMFGERFSSARHLPRTGSMVENPGFYLNLSAEENLEIWRILTGTQIRGAVVRALETVGLTEAAGKKVGQFSLGMKQRLALARAVLHGPEFLILDEPTNGLDPAGIQQMRTLLVQLSREKGITVFLSSHLLSEVEQIADRVGIIHRGRLCEEVSLAELNARNRQFIDLRVSDEAKTSLVLERDLGVKDYRVNGGGSVQVFSCLDRPEHVNRTLVGHGIEVSMLTIHREDLEEYFLKLTGENDDRTDKN